MFHRFARVEAPDLASPIAGNARFGRWLSKVSSLQVSLSPGSGMVRANQNFLPAHPRTAGGSSGKRVDRIVHLAIMTTQSANPLRPTGATSSCGSKTCNIRYYHDAFVMSQSGHIGLLCHNWNINPAGRCILRLLRAGPSVSCLCNFMLDYHQASFSNC